MLEWIMEYGFWIIQARITTIRLIITKLEKNNIFLIWVIKEEKDPVHEADVCESPIGKKN